MRDSGPSSSRSQVRDSRDRRPRRMYVRPRLTRLGSVRHLTLGGSPGVGDSGGALMEKP